MRPLAMILVCAVVAACTTTLPKVRGNQAGGTINWFGTNDDEVYAAAQQHCRGFGRNARITAMQKYAGGSVIFDCV